MQFHSSVHSLTSLFSKRKFNEFTRSHAMKQSNPVRLPQTNPVAFPALVITYNPSLRSISSIIQKHFKILSSSPRCNNIFQTTPLVAFRRTDNLRDILVRSKLRTDQQTDHTKGSFRCGKNCITCRYITDDRTNYTFSATGEMRTIHDHIDCNSKNLIYMIHCLRYNNNNFINLLKKAFQLNLQFQISKT